MEQYKGELDDQDPSFIAERVDAALEYIRHRKSKAPESSPVRVDVVKRHIGWGGTEESMASIALCYGKNAGVIRYFYRCSIIELKKKAPKEELRPLCWWL